MSEAESPEQLQARIKALEVQLEQAQRRQAAISGQGSIAQGQDSTAISVTGADSLGIGKIGRDAIIGDNNRLITTIINLYRQGDPKQTNEAILRRQITGYLRGLANRYSRLELRGIKREGQQVIQLELDQVYVPLAARAYRRGQAEKIQLDQLLQLGPQVVITGGPGSGKTTVLLRLASILALAIGSDTPALAATRLGVGLPSLVAGEKGEGVPLPVYLPLSSYARYRRDLPKGRPAEETTLAAFISYYLIRRGQGSFDLPPDFFQQLLRTGRQVIVLLDGLDEVPGENERVEVREAIEGLLDGRPDLQLVATCRSAAYSGRAVLGRKIPEVMVQPLTGAHIEQLVRQAYEAPDLFGAEPGLAKQKSDELLQAITTLEAQRRRVYGDETEPLITSPLLVRMLIIVHLSDRRLPDQRAELYKKATDNLLLPEYQPDQEVANELGELVGGSQNVHRELAQHLAFTMHRRGPVQGRELDEFELREILGKHPTYPHLARNFIDLARSRSTLLEERDGQYRFIHLAFQEFLVAGYLADVIGGESGYGGIVTFLESGPLLDSWWREPILLVAGYYNIDKPTAAQKFLRRLAGLDRSPGDRPPDIPLAAAEVAGAAALEWPGLPEGLKEALARRLADFFSHPAWLARTSPTLRAKAGDTLALLGDPRPEGMTVEGMQFCAVPPGPFMMGSPSEDGMAYGDEKPLHPVMLNYGYWIGRYPVTAAQWQVFVREREHQPKSEASLSDPLNRPVRYVTWYEADTFCAWLTSRWRQAGLLPKEWQVRLPSEAEWEKAARGGVHLPETKVMGTLGELNLAAAARPGKQRENGPVRRYPWGEALDRERANYDETGINTTSAVGCFPGGASPYGVEELSGNVWEWTRSLWGKDLMKADYVYPYDPLDGREKIEAGKDISCVLRGGGFGNYDRLVRCAMRNRNVPDSWDWDYGFRVVVAPLFDQSA